MIVRRRDSMALTQVEAQNKGLWLLDCETLAISGGVTHLYTRPP